MKKRVQSIKGIRHFLSNLPPFLLTGVTVISILWLTLSPRPFGSLHTPFFPGADKLAHALMFGFLVAMAALDRTRKNKFHPLSAIYLFSCAALSTLLGVAIEYLQEVLNTGRSFEYADMVADSSGAFAAAIILLIFQPKSEA